MKFTCEKYLLDAAVTTAGRAAPVKPTIDSLSGLLVQAAVSVCITGYDLKKGIYTRFEADVSAQGSVVVNARLLGEIVRKLPDGIVTFVSDGNNMVNISCGNADYSIMGSDPEDYPDLPDMDYSHSITMMQDVLSRMISETSFAISDNESRPVYTGALFEVENDDLTIVAVDGYRLALRREALSKSDTEECRFIVPGSALSDLEKICCSVGDPVSITVGSKHISFTVGDTVLITRRLEGEFLNYKKTLPSVFPVTLTANRSELIRCAERVSLIIDDRTKNPLRCCFDDNVLNISCATPLGRAEDSCALRGSGGGMLIGFNNTYLLQALKAAPCEELTVNLTNGNSPCVLLPVDESGSFLYMILPVRMRG